MGVLQGKVDQNDPSFGTIVWDVKVHLCAKYGHIIMKYGMDMAIALVI